MPSGASDRSQSWMVGSWWRPALATMVAVATAVGVVHRHRDVGSVLAAVVCLAFAACTWRTWRRARRHRPPDAGRRLGD